MTQNLYYSVENSGAIFSRVSERFSDISELIVGKGVIP
jgi:hypothetical protein